MRAVAERPTKYRPVAPETLAAMSGASYYDAATREIQQAGCRALGDLAEEYPDGTVTQPARWFVDGSGTACGWFAIVGLNPAAAARQIVVLDSEAPGGEFYITSRGGTTSATATSPHHHLADCRRADGLAKQLEVHRAQIPAGQAAALTRIATIDDATGLFARSKQAKIDWRARQPAEALLDQDLRQILQDRYPAFGAALLAYMQKHPAGS
jgi:hypothetical protein